jgi:predicted alpha-1,2-mannosidase
VKNREGEKINSLKECSCCEKQRGSRPRRGSCGEGVSSHSPIGLFSHTHHPLYPLINFRNSVNLPVMKLMRHFILCILPAALLFACRDGNLKESSSARRFVQYVDPFIGSGGHGHTFPGATLPFGMIQLSPDTRIDGSWDGCSGYHASDTLIYGFSHTHLSGTGCSDYGDILLMPSTGEPSLDNKIYASGFSHSTEKASPGYYSVLLKNGGIRVELAASTRTGMHKYIFPKAGSGNIVIDLLHRDKTLESRLEVLDKTHIEGMRRSQAWAKNQQIYFSLEFSRPFKSSLLLADAREGESNASGRDRGGVFTFAVAAGDSILVKIGISTVSMEGARKNLNAEIPGWDFLLLKEEAEATWEKELEKIEVTSPDKTKLKIFYTALYHTLIQPNLNMDVDSMYRGRDNAIHRAKGFSYYSVFSLWDTFRAVHPLYTIIEPKRTADFINTFLAQYREGGRLPVWDLASNETDCMIGYHAVSVITDAAAKGISGFDPWKALEAMKSTANGKRFGVPAYIRQGFLSAEDEPESVSKTLEYAYDDWCISRMASLLDKAGDVKEYLHRSQSYRNLFDPGTGFMRPRRNGCWLDPFDPKEVNNYYTEANAWQYTFFVPHDLPHYIQMMGGPEKFAAKLDSLFSTGSQTTGRNQIDISGFIGQYAHGNEPSHHIAYLYNFCGQPWKTQERVHQILTEFYKATPDGIIGNEDCGQLSAWYVLSSLGFYPVTPGDPVYAIGTPQFTSARVHLENGKVFSINADNLSDENHYVQQVSCTHAQGNPFVLAHTSILTGETLRFEMGSKPHLTEAIQSRDSKTQNIPDDFVTAPVLTSTAQVFRKPVTIGISENQTGTKIFYTTNGSAPTSSSKVYSDPFTISKTTTVRAVALLLADTGLHSGITTGTFHKFPNSWSITLKSDYVSQYSGGGEEALIDGIRGDANWRKGAWQGYQGEDFEAVVDLGKTQTISHLSAGFLQDIGAWIFFPKEVDYFLSSDGKTFKHIATADNTVSESDEKIQTREFGMEIRKQKARYIKIRATNYGKLPFWHPGKGGEALLFIDEIEVE